MSTKMIIETLMKDKRKKNKVKPFDQTLQSRGIILEQQKVVK